MQQTVRDIIVRALKKCGACGANEVPAAEDVQDGFAALNNMLNEWSSQPLMVRGTITETFPLVQGQSSYSIGASASLNFNTSKPFSIFSAEVIDSSNTSYPVEIIDMATYNAIPDALYNTGRPRALAFDPTPAQQTVNQGKIYVYYIPDQGYTLKIESHKPFTEFANLSDVVTLEPHYPRALIYNLAVDMWADFHDASVQVPQILFRVAEESKHNLRVVNSSRAVSILDVPGTSRGTFDIRTYEGS